MVSVYQYAALADVEAFTGIDYSAINSTKFTAALVDAKITLAERMVNGYMGVTVDQTTTDGIKMATIIIAAKILHNNLIELGFHGKDEHNLEIIDMSIPSILRLFLSYDAGVDAIPMSGADR
ncbi:unnamed protein product [marine sediment metagenome]|uniref:Uncharacterized protein n=1 Tax=marine sediment metagenome TaxID=412755 RepID=X0Y2H4_9ZZZZ